MKLCVLIQNTFVCVDCKGICHKIFLEVLQKVNIDFNMIRIGNLTNFTFIPNEQCLCISLHAEFRPMELLLSLN